jgi:hypothetical protein
MNVRGNRQKPIANRKTPNIVCLWEAGLTNENPESSPLPKGTRFFYVMHSSPGHLRIALVRCTHSNRRSITWRNNRRLTQSLEREMYRRLSNLRSLRSSEH